MFPRHYEYRVVRCKASALSEWNHLFVHRSLARNVRQLEVLDERAAPGDVVVPSDIRTTDTDLESTDDELGMHHKQERFVLAALSRMTALQTFKWSCNHSLVSFERLWPALIRCQSLREVEVNDNLIFQPIDDPDTDSTEQGAQGTASRRSKQRQIVVCYICCMPRNTLTIHILSCPR